MSNEQKGGESSVKNITLGVVLGWIVGVLFIIAAVSSFASNAGIALVYLFIGIFLLPAFGNWLNEKKHVRISGGLKIVVVVLVLILASIMSASSKAENAVANARAGGDTTTLVAGSSETNKLELLNYNCTSEYGYFEISGQVKNISSESLKDIEAVGSMLTSKGEFINSSTAILEYNPILPGQTSPFKVMMTENPESGKCTIEFKELFGGTVPTKRDK